MIDYDFVETAQAVLTGVDTASARKFREEQRTWRRDDLQWRLNVHNHLTTQRQLREEQEIWRQQELEQRMLDNARVLWARSMELNRRGVEEHVEKLRSVSELAALIAGFAVIAFLDFNFQVANNVTVWFFGFTTALVVGMELNSMVMCSLMMVSAIRFGRSYVSDDEEAEFITRCYDFAQNYRPGDSPPAPRRSFARHWETRCEGRWLQAFALFLAGVPVFFTNIALAGWLRFGGVLGAAATVTVALAGALVLCVLRNRTLLLTILQQGGEAPLAPQEPMCSWCP